MVAFLVLVVGAKGVDNFNMNKTSFLAPKNQAKNKANLLMYQWAYSVLSQMGVDFDDSIPDDGDPENLNVLQRAKMRKILEMNKILVLDNQDGSLEIYVDDELIGKWDIPYYKLCYDPKEINPNDKYFMEVDICFGSVFDNEVNNV
jgi:hypothetical protein